MAAGMKLSRPSDSRGGGGQMTLDAGRLQSFGDRQRLCHMRERVARGKNQNASFR